MGLIKYETNRVRNDFVKIQKDVISELEQHNYHKVTVNAEGLSLYYTVLLRQAYIVLLADAPMGDEYSKEQFDHITKQIQESFLAREFDEVFLLGVIFTADPGKAKVLCDTIERRWIVDTTESRLLIFENQKETFLNMRELIESAMGQKQARGGYLYEDAIGYPDADYDVAEEEAGRKKVGWSNFTLCNSLIILLNVLVFAYLEWTGSTTDTEFMLRHGAMYWPFVTQYGEFYRLFTYMFLHYGIEHIFNNMIVLAFLGDNLERSVGKARYLLLYIGSGLVAGLASMGYNIFLGKNVVAVGASGAIFGVVGAMLYIVIVNRGRLEDISQRQLILFAALSIYSGFTSQGTDNVAHIAGFVFGFLLATIAYRKPRKRERYGR